MTDDTTLDRRRFVQGTNAAAATLLLAGCSGGGDAGDGGGGSDGGDGGDGSGGDGSDGSGGDGSGGSGDDGGDTQYLSEEPDYAGWLDGANNYEQTVDATGQDRVTVSVGAGDGLSFGPAAVAVSPGTTVVWEWTGEGGGHNVSAESGAFESDTSQESGNTFEYTFEETGVHEYVCTPHQSVGMKGAVVVR